MRKLKLIVASLALLVGGANFASAYTTDDLISDGWTQVTSETIVGNGDNYYILVDAYSSNYVMSSEADHYRPCYKTIANPVSNPSFVWILEGSDNKFSFKNYATGAYFKQTVGWNTSVGDGRGKSAVTGQFTLNSGKYDIKCIESDAMVGHWNDNTSGVANDGENIAANKGTQHADGFFLYAISKSSFDAAVIAARSATLASATKSTPVEVTSWIQNADWTGDWGGWECTVTSSGNMQWGEKTLESWNANNVIVKQELNGIPNGCYKLTADLISGNNDNMVAYVFAIGDSKVSSVAVSAVSSATNYTTMSNEVAGNTLTADNVSVTSNNVTVGFDQAAGWIVADNFKLYYYGPNLAAASSLPDGEDMTADTWYYFDVAIAGTYNITCTTLSDIVYSTDGSILVEDDASVTNKFSENSVELTAGRYYVKSASSQTLSVVAASYVYTVGSATANISYVQPGNIVTVTYADLNTNNTNADIDIDFSGVTFNGDALNVTPTSNGFSFTIPDVEAGTENTLAIPAGAIGYEEGSEFNAAQNIILTSVAIYDGVYYMYNTDTKSYISRAGMWNTQAILDNWGLAFLVSTDANNNTQLQYFDSKLWLGYDGTCFGDCSGGNIRYFNVTKVPGGYKFLNTNNNKYLAANNGATVADAEEGVNLVGTSNIWSLESTTDHVENYTLNANVQAATAASAASIDGISSKTELVSELTTKYFATSISITGAKAEKFQVYPNVVQEATPATYYSETINGLKPGIYKLSVDAFQRAAGNDRVSAADGARSLVYIYAGDAKTQIKSVMEYGAASAYGSDFAYEGKHYPNNESSAYQALATGNYTNDVFVYVADEGEGTGSLEIGIKNPSRLGDNFSTWVAYNNWTLTYYASEVSVEVTSASFATYVAPCTLDFTGKSIEAYKVKVNEKGVAKLTKVDEVPAGTPVLLYKEGGAIENIPVIASAAEITENDLVAGTGAAVATTDGDYTNMILNNVGGEVGFYFANDKTVATNRAYLHILTTLAPDKESEAPMIIQFSDEVTGISEVNAVESVSGEIYNLAGQRVAKATKGLYILNGKKVLVK